MTMYGVLNNKELDTLFYDVINDLFGLGGFKHTPKGENKKMFKLEPIKLSKKEVQDSFDKVDKVDKISTLKPIEIQLKLKEDKQDIDKKQDVKQPIEVELPKRMCHDIKIEAQGTSKEATHYQNSAMQPIQYCQAMLTSEQFDGFLIGNVIKYICRARHKGKYEEDMIKANQYAYWRKLAQEGKLIDPVKDTLPLDFEFKGL